MNRLARPSELGTSRVAQRLFEPWMESPGLGYLLSGALAVGIHAAVLFGWRDAARFEPAEYGVVIGESAVEVELIAAPPAPEVEAIESQAPVETQEVVETQEPVTQVESEPEPEPVPPSPVPEISSFQEMPKPEKVPEVKPASSRPPAISSSNPRPVARKARSSSAPQSIQPGSHSSAGNPTSGSLTSKPAYLYNPHPSYPEVSRKAGHTGVVMLRVSIDERGRVSGVSLIKSSGHSLLDERARTAVQRWTFRPARQNGRPVATRVDVPVRFSLDR